MSTNMYNSQTKLAVRLNRGGRSAGRNYPEPARHLHDARRGPLHLPGRRPATNQRASGQARPRTHSARVEVTLRSRPLAIGSRAPQPRPTTLSPRRQERPRLPAYAGHTVAVVNRDTGELREAQIFVAVLGASNYTYAEATWTQTLPDWIASHVRAFEFMGGTTELLIPDDVPRNIIRVMCRPG